MNTAQKTAGSSEAPPTAAADSKGLVVFSILRDSQCSECQEELGKGEFLVIEKGNPLCLNCSDLAHLVYLPNGDAALTRRARKYSSLSAVVVRFSRSRGRYERQGLMVEPAALERAEDECLSDADKRGARRERAEELRSKHDYTFAQQVAARIRELFPGCPAAEARSIAAHTTLRSSGRVGRTAAAKSLEEDAISAAVIAAIRHTRTPYDRLLMEGRDRTDARIQVRNTIDDVLERWRG